MIVQLSKSEQTISQEDKERIAEIIRQQLYPKRSFLSYMGYIGAHAFGYGVAMYDNREMVFLRFKASGAAYKKGLYIYVLYDSGADEYVVEGIVTHSGIQKIVGEFAGLQASDLEQNILRITDGAKIKPTIINPDEQTKGRELVKVLKKIEDYAGISIAYRETDLNGNPKQYWMKILEPDVDKQRASDSLKIALATGKIEKSIMDGDIMPQDVVRMIKASGIEVPADMITLADIEVKHVPKQGYKMVEYINSLGIPEDTTEADVMKDAILPNPVDDTGVDPTYLLLFKAWFRSFNWKVSKKKINDYIEGVPSDRRGIYNRALNYFLRTEEITDTGEYYEKTKFQEIPKETQQFKKGGQIIEPTEQELAERWDKKKDHIMQLAGNIRKLRYNLTRDMKSEDEKVKLTALVIAIMDKTSERIGNASSAESGHFGISWLKKSHIKIDGNTIHLKYVGKSGVEHEKSFSDETIAIGLKWAIKKSPDQYVFTTSDGFKIRPDRVNRFLSDYSVSAKDIRAFSANKYILDKLKDAEEAPEQKDREKIFRDAVKYAAQKVGHGAATLKKHYLIPELEKAYIMRGELLDISDFYKTGGMIKMEDGGQIYQGGSGAGIFIIAKKTGRGLLLRRSELVSEPNTWAFVSGEIDGDETPEQTVLREAEEEIGGVNLIALKQIHVFKAANADFTFYNYLGLVEDEFVPQLNQENTEHMWIDIESLPAGIHFGVAEVFDTVDVMDEVISLYAEEPMEMAKGGNILLAPNGKPSNLNSEQYRLVRTPEFIAFFGNWLTDPENASKIVDINGEPLPVFHGTDKSFTVFKETPDAAFGYHFSGKKEYSESYGNVLEVFLNAKNLYRTTEDAVNSGSGLVPREAFENGYDGWCIAYSDGTSDYAVFHPEQIKLANGSNTTFDSSNPDIRFEKGGVIVYGGGGINEDIPVEVLEKIKEKFGFDKFKQIGVGLFGTAFKINNNMVAKVTSDLDEYTYAKKIVGRQNKHIADIYGVYHFEYNNRRYAVIIKEYCKMDKADVNDLIDKFDISTNNKVSLSYLSSEYIAGQIPKDEFNKYIDSYIKSGLGRESLIRDWAEMVAEIKSYRIYVKDFNAGNIGFKKSGNLCMIELGLGGNRSSIKMDKEDKLIFADGGDIDKHDMYSKWKTLVNMTPSELKAFYDSEEGKAAGLSATAAHEHGIHYGRESARWILKMKDTKVEDWTPEMWEWAKRQISFISRMKGNAGSLRDESGAKTRKLTSLLIWGHNPEKMANGGAVTKGLVDIPEEAQLFIDIISDNPEIASSSRYKKILYDNYGIDFDAINNDDKYIDDASLHDVKTQNDFLSFDKWLKYGKIISEKRGFINPTAFDNAMSIGVSDEKLLEISKKLEFDLVKIPYIERGSGSGDVARVEGNTLKYAFMDAYYLAHELGHIFSHKYNVHGWQSLMATNAPTKYGNTNQGEAFAENFAIYFIAPDWLKSKLPLVYHELDVHIPNLWKDEIREVLNNGQGDMSNGGGSGVIQSESDITFEFGGDINNDLGAALFYLDTETDYKIYSAQRDKKKLGLNYRVTKYQKKIMENENIGYYSDAQLLQLAKDNGFGKLQETPLEKMIYAEAVKCGDLECDGAVRVLHYALNKNNVPHYVFQGTVELDDKKIPLHYWIGLYDGRIVDFKAKMWLGDDAPNGIFFADKSAAKYDGMVVDLPVSEFVYLILTKEI